MLKCGLVDLKKVEMGVFVEWMRECEKGVFATGHPCNPFQGKYPTPNYWITEKCIHHHIKGTIQCNINIYVLILP